MIKKYSLFLFLFVIPLHVPAQEANKQYIIPTQDYKRFQINNKPSFYFPGGIYDDFIVEAYTKHLKAMKEPSLWADSKKTELQSYRFLWLRTFHHPIVIRLNIKSDRSGELICKETSGAGGYAPGELTINRTTSLSLSQVSIFLKSLDKANFWEMASKGGTQGEDGAQWIIEGVKNRKYHLVERWCPKRGEFREAALILLNLSGLKQDAKPMY